jgi:hypothetical protein
MLACFEACIVELLAVCATRLSSLRGASYVLLLDLNFFSGFRLPYTYNSLLKTFINQNISSNKSYVALYTSSSLYVPMIHFLKNIAPRLA